MARRGAAFAAPQSRRKIFNGSLEALYSGSFKANFSENLMWEFEGQLEEGLSGP